MECSPPRVYAGSEPIFATPDICEILPRVPGIFPGRLPAHRVSRLGVAFRPYIAEGCDGFRCIASPQRAQDP